MKPSDDRRLMALYNLDILDTAPTEQFDRVIRLACRLFNVPIALVSFIEDDRQWFKAKRGLCLTETPRVVAFCDWTVRSADVHVVEDASADERFRDNPLVTGDPHIRFYAGAPLSFEGEQVGSVCVIVVSPCVVVGVCLGGGAVGQGCFGLCHWCLADHR
mgnify:CR=1 FL=1